MRKIQTNRTGGCPFSNHDIDGKIFHGRVKNFLHLPVQTMYLVYKQYITFLKIIQYGSHLSRLFYGRTRCYFHMHTHFIGYNSRKCSFSQSRRTVKQHMIQHVSTPKSIYQRPANQFVANFIGRSNTLHAHYVNGALKFGNGFTTAYDNMGAAPEEDVVAVRPEEFVIDEHGEDGIDATVVSSVFLGLNTTYFVELYDGTQAEIVEESSISSIIPNGTKVRLGLKLDKINVFTADGSVNLTKGVVNDVR